MNKKEQELLYLEYVLAPFQKELKDLISKINKNTIRRKNPYLYQLIGIKTAKEFATKLVNDSITSGMETKFGKLLENFAIHISNGEKLEEKEYKSVDFLFNKNNN